MSSGPKFHYHHQKFFIMTKKWPSWEKFCHHDKKLIIIKNCQDGKIFVTMTKYSLQWQNFHDIEKIFVVPLLWASDNCWNFFELPEVKIVMLLLSMISQKGNVYIFVYLTLNQSSINWSNEIKSIKALTCKIFTSICIKRTFMRSNKRFQMWN